MEIKINRKIRLPAVAGQFYPASGEKLKETVNSYLDQVKVASFSSPRAIIAPHAGYPFSGGVAAYSFAGLKGKKVDTVVLLGNSHTSYFDGLAIDDNDAWQTPLGEVEIDRKLAQKLVEKNSFIKFDSKVHARDHVLEVELPFLQVVLKEGFKIVPILFGNSQGSNYKDLAGALVNALGEDDLIVVSSDMSHYPPYEDAKKIDADTLEFIKRKDVSDLEEHILSVMSMNILNEDTLICGPDAIKTVMEMASQLDWQAHILKYANSGDVRIGDREAVVGYGAVIFEGKARDLPEEDKEEDNILNEEQKKILLKIAKETVENFVEKRQEKDFKINDERLSWSEGVFVTLHNQGRLRGCIGQIISPDTPLWHNVRNMAISACSQDSRFLPITSSELPFLDYEVSVLSEPKKIDDWQRIELGKHGVIISKGFRHGVFLPQVATETGWDREEFLSQLCSQKAGLKSDCYKNDPGVKIEVFTAQVFSDKEIK